METNSGSEIWAEFNLVESKFLEISARYGESKRQFDELCVKNNVQIHKLKAELKQLTSPGSMILAFKIDEEKFIDQGKVSPLYYCIDNHSKRIFELRTEIRDLIDELNVGQKKFHKIQTCFQDSLSEYNLISDKIHDMKESSLNKAADISKLDVILDQDYTLVEKIADAVKYRLSSMFRRKN
ncbi:MAG: hypothetical protein Q8T08_21920 [Ignavibacteria bacterium]|nr:hypothetical protein [Ignavibacteria bacterium]